MEHMIRFDPTTELLVSQIKSKRKDCIHREDYASAANLQQQEKQLLVIGANLLRISKDWDQSIQQERYEDAAHCKALAQEQRNNQYTIVGSSLQSAAILESTLTTRPPPPAAAVRQWIQHSKLLLSAQAPTGNNSALSKLIVDYQRCQLHQYTNEFIVTIESILSKELLDAIKPMLFELESERIVQQQLQKTTSDAVAE